MRSDPLSGPKVALATRSAASVRRRALAAGLTTAMAAAGLAAIAAATPAEAAAACKVVYEKNDWGSGFTTNITITNQGDAMSAWTLKYSYTGNQRLGNGWNGQWSQSGQNVTVNNAGHNGTLAAGSSTTIGAQFAYSGTNTDPTAFTLNGTPCNGTGPGPTTPPPTSPPPTSPTPTPGNRVDNPYAGAKVYVNPVWSANAAAEAGGSRIANQPTAVWLDRIAAVNGVNGGMGLRAHLDEAVRQQAGVIQLVIYNLPGRDCSALASNGEIKADELPKYKTQYIDPIAAILGDAKYANLRIVTVVEIDSIPNLITNVSPRPTATANCDTMKANGNYVNGVGYALAKLGAVPNVYNYIDVGHHGWLGWDDNLGPTADLLLQTSKASGSTPANVHGFISNTANYGALKEPYFTINDSVNGTSVRQSKWVDWNRYVDELSYAQGIRQRLVQAGFDANIGMLIDTSRNGWGGTARPTGPGPQTTVDTYVDGGRLDRRIHLGNWCNQSGAGIGERPKAAPEPGIDAYVWIKPPGESDGASSEIPNDEGKGFDRMCDPTYTGNPRNNNNRSGALANAPLSGHWFSSQFQELMRNAYPPLP